jgi:GNAT superfamily N-acetyltransferase
MQRQLTDNLLLRPVQSDDDVERLAAFYSAIHSDTPDPDQRIGAWAAQALTPGGHPTVTWEDFLLVEDVSTGEVVSSLGVIPQTWAYAGIPFGVGRVELVGTHPDYRGRGLIRAQFEAIHARCDELGLPVQAITGIPYFYRQFGYEFALDLEGGWHIPLSAIPETPADSPFSMRVWSEEGFLGDLPRLQALYERAARGKLVTCLRPDDHWHHRYLAQDPRSISHRWLYVIARAEAVVGYAVILAETWGTRALVSELVLDAPYPEIVPWLLPRLRDEIGLRLGDASPPVTTMFLSLTARHPIVPYLARYYPTRRKPYAWYLRVADLAAFVWHIRDALARRIARGPLAGLTRTLELNFYRGGLRLTVESGQLVAAENLPRSVTIVEDAADADFPPLVFLQLLFGYRSFKALTYAFPDVYCKPEIHPILAELFPKQPSWVVGLY